MNYIPELIKEYVVERSKRNVKIKVLTPQPSPKTLEYMQKTNNPSGGEYKILPKGFDLTSEYLIYQDKVANISLNQKSDKIWDQLFKIRN